ncbi:putative ribonuclease H-like domain-containing protein, partial [Tanacetum coccineum]
NQTNGNEGTKENINAGLDGKKIVPDQKYILLPLVTSDPLLFKSSKDSPDAGFKPSREEEKIDSEHQENKDSEVPNKEEPIINQEHDANVNSTNNINTVSPTVNAADIENNVVDENIVYGCIDDPNMPNLENIVYSDDDEEVGVEADMNNLATKAMQDKLLQFQLQKVWTLVDLPYGKRVIGTKWVYRNKKDDRGIVVRNKMDVKSAFLYGTIEEEVYVCQPPGFEDPQFPDKVYKVEKALYGLHQAPKAWYETLSTYLLENRFRRGTIDKTLFIKKDKGDILLVQVYVDDIIFGSTKKSLCVEFEQMMHKRFQMSSIGELTFFLGLQTASTLIETNKALLKDEEAKDVDVHLYRSMIGSLMYLTASRPNIMFAVYACARDSPFDLEAFSDSDYIGASIDRKSTTGGCQFLSKRLISWQCKKQTIVANSTTEAKYVAAANCCGQSSGPIHLVADETVIKEWEDGMERAATTASSLEVEKDSGNINMTQSMATINESFPQGTDSALPVQVNAVEALVDKKKVIITETSIRSDLKLNDAEGIDCLPTATIFAELERMSAKTTAWNEFSSNMASAIISLATNQKFNFSKYSFDNMVKHLEGGVKFLMYPRFVQVFLDKQVEGMTRHKEVYVTPSHTKKVFANMKRSGKAAEANLRVEILFDVSLARDQDWMHQKQGRKITDLDADAEVTLVDETQEMNDDNLMFDTSVLEEQEKEVVEKEVTTANAPTTTIDELTLAQTLIEIKAAKPKVVTSAATTTTTTRSKARGVVVQDPSEFKTTSSPSQASQH